MAARLLLAVLVVLAGCQSEPHKTDAELGLNAQQSAGRRVFQQDCAECHYAYISRGLHGPSLEGLFRMQFLSSGMPANDDRVREIILSGRAQMPAFGPRLSSQQVNDLLAYLHTL